MPKNIKHYLIELNGDHEIANAVEKAIHRFSGSNSRTIVFCETKREVGTLMTQLNVKSAALHGDVKQ
jgi:superfamily II DNA/RNA helicase